MKPTPATNPLLRPFQGASFDGTNTPRENLVRQPPDEVFVLAAFKFRGTFLTECRQPFPGIVAEGVNRSG